MRRTLTVILSLCFFSAMALAEDGAIQLGWTGPLSGNSAVLGIDSVQAARIAIDECNEAGGIAGRKVVLIAEDDQYDTAKAVTAYNKLVKLDKVKALLMSTYGGVFATAGRAVQDDVVVLNPLDCNNDIAALPENTFCIATLSESIGEVIARNISSKDIASVGILYDESNPFMVLVHAALLQRLAEFQVDDVSSYGLSGDTNDFRSVLLKVRQKGNQAVVFFGHDPMGGAMKQARTMGIEAQFYTVGTITSPGYQKLAGESANGSLVAYWEAPRTKEYDKFIETFTEKVGRPPILELATIPSYDSMKLLLLALSKAATDDGSIDIDVLRKSLLSTKEYPGLSGTLTMDSDGAVRSIREKIYHYTDGTLHRGKLHTAATLPAG